MWNNGSRMNDGHMPPFPLMHPGNRQRFHRNGVPGRGFPMRGRPGRLQQPPLPPRMPMMHPGEQFRGGGPLPRPDFVRPMMHSQRMPPAPYGLPQGFVGPMFRPSGPMMNRNNGYGDNGYSPMRMGRGGIKRRRGGDRPGGQRFNKKQPIKMMRGDGDFHCDTCDRNYETRGMLDEHLASHKKCGIGGCTFEAHPKIFDLHVKMQHDTGLADKIIELNSDEAIEKWKSERRRHFPTAENVARRQAEQEEKLLRGELLQDKQFGKFNKMGRGRGRGKNRLTTQTASRRPTLPVIPSIIDGGRPSTSFPGGIFDPGYISFEDDSDRGNRDGGINGSTSRGRQYLRGRNGRGRGGRGGRFRRTFRGKKTPMSTEKKQMTRAGVWKFRGALPSPVVVTLVKTSNGTNIDKSNVGLSEASGSGMITDSEGELVEMSVTPNSNGNVQQAAVNVESDDCDSDVPLELSSKVKPAEVQMVQPSLALPGALASLVAAYESASEIEDALPNEKNQKTKIDERTKLLLERIPRSATGKHNERKPTLLEMLLAKEIRHERNVILQCVRHIVRNNFYDRDDSGSS